MVLECFLNGLEPYIWRFQCKEWKQFRSFHVMHSREIEFTKSSLNPHKFRQKYLPSFHTSQNIFSHFWSESFQEARTKFKRWQNFLDDQICVKWNFGNILWFFFFPSPSQNGPRYALYCVKQTFLMVFECFLDGLESYICRYQCKEWKQFGSFHVMHRSEIEITKSWLNPHMFRQKYLPSFHTSQNIFSQHRLNFWSESFQEARTKFKRWPNSLDDQICVKWNFGNILRFFFFPSPSQNGPRSALYSVLQTFLMVFECFCTVWNHIFVDFIAKSENNSDHFTWCIVQKLSSQRSDWIHTS